MRLINPDSRTIGIAANELYKYGGNLQIQVVDYDYFHLLVHYDDEIQTRFGVVVFEKGTLLEDTHKTYIDSLRTKTYRIESSDNTPIILLEVDSMRERAKIGVQLGWSSAFTPIVYTRIDWREMNQENFDKIFTILKSMNTTISVLSMNYVSILKAIRVEGKREYGFNFDGYILYARKLHPNYPKLTPQCKTLFEEDDLNKYLYKPQYELDEIDNYIMSLTQRGANNIAEITLEANNNKALLTSADVKELQLYGKEIGGFDKYKLSYAILPNLDDIEPGMIGNTRIFPFSFSKITLVLNGNNHVDTLINSLQAYRTSKIPYNNWEVETARLRILMDTVIDVGDFIL